MGSDRRKVAWIDAENVRKPYKCLYQPLYRSTASELLSCDFFAFERRHPTKMRQHQRREKNIIKINCVLL
jgi:hypothetical protein